MRCDLGVLIAAAVGIHCSAPVEEPSVEASAPDLVAVEPPAATHGPSGVRARAAQANEDGPSLDAYEPQVRAVATLAHAIFAPKVTSVARGAAGETYVTGTFVGVVRIGETTIKSRGDKDVFLLKLDAGGALAWVRAVGSADVERAPHVTIEGPHITLLGMTNGEMDCGNGPLQLWSTETFFVCIFGGVDGASISGGVFPTGAP